MPKLTPFEAPMTGYNIPTEGITAYERSAAVAREAGSQKARMLHQEGATLEEGMKLLGRGINDFNKDADAKPVADKHEELLTAVDTNNSATQLHMELLTSYNQSLSKGRDSNDPKWFEKWQQETFNQKIADFQAGANGDKDGMSRLTYVKGWQSHFLFTRGPADELDRATASVKTSYNQTKATAMTSVVGGGDIKPDGSEATLLQSLQLSDTALANVLSSGINVDYKKMADAHTNEQHDLVLASAETRIKSATTKEEVEAALNEVRDPKRGWVNNKYGLNASDYATLEKAADRHLAKLASKQTAEYTKADHDAKMAYNTVTNDMLSKAYNRAYDAAKDDKLDDVLKQHGAFIKADEVATFRKNIAYIQNHPGENTVMDVNVYNDLMGKASKGQLTAAELVQNVKDHKITEENMKALHSISQMVSKDEFEGNSVNAMLRTADIVHGHADFNTGVITDKEDALRMLRFRTQFYPAMQRMKEEGKFDRTRDLDIENKDGLAYKVGKDIWRTAEERAANPLGMRTPEVKTTVPAPLSHINSKFLKQDPKTGEIWNMLDGKIYDRNGQLVPAGPQVPRSQ